MDSLAPHSEGSPPRAPSAREVSGFVDEVLGAPWLLAGRGPRSYDCLGVLLYLYRRAGVELPDPVEMRSSRDHAMLRDLFVRVEGAEAPLDVLYLTVGTDYDPLRLGRRERPHVSICQGDGLAVTAMEHGGVSRLDVRRIPVRERLRLRAWT